MQAVYAKLAKVNMFSGTKNAKYINLGYKVQFLLWTTYFNSFEIDFYMGKMITRFIGNIFIFYVVYSEKKNWCRSISITENGDFQTIYSIKFDFEVKIATKNLSFFYSKLIFFNTILNSWIP